MKRIIASNILVLALLVLMNGCGGSAPPASVPSAPAHVPGPAPVVVSVSPSSGIAGGTFAMGSTVIIDGSNFSAYAGNVGGNWPRVYFNGVLGSTYSSTGNQIIATVPQGATTGSLIVETLDGSSAAVPFTVTGTAFSTPIPSSFAPSSGSAGTSVTITGSGFDPVATNNLVFLSDGQWVPTTKTIQATVASATATQLTFTVPAGLNLGPNYILVGNSTGSRWSMQPFTVQ